MTIDFIPLIFFILITTFTPRPNNILSSSMGLMYGYRKILEYLFGIALGFFIVMVVCAYLSSTLLLIIPGIEGVLIRWVGASNIMVFFLPYSKPAILLMKSGSPQSFLERDFFYNC